MTGTERIQTEIHQTHALLRDKLGVRGRTIGKTLKRTKRLVPGRVHGALADLARAEPFLDHPKLRLTLDADGLSRSAGEVRTHLDSIDVADRRKGWWLGMLGAMSFNLIAFAALLIVVLVWRGFL